MLPVAVFVASIIKREKPKLSTARMVTVAILDVLILAGWCYYAWTTEQPLIAAIFLVGYLSGQMVRAATPAAKP